VLVLSGEPGIGKSALVDYLMSAADGFCVLRATGVEVEAKFAFAGLHALCLPVLDTFRRRAQELPADTQRFLLVASAGHAGDAETVWRAVDSMGVDKEAAEPAAEAGLVELGARVRFRHPLMRSAVYRASPPAQRRAAHRALAAATHPMADPDRRAWHLAAATVGPDEQVAEELQRSAGRAHERGGAAAAAVTLERAAATSPCTAAEALSQVASRSQSSISRIPR
jgi:hypothetical protein